MSIVSLSMYSGIEARPIAYDMVLRNALESALPQPEAYTFSTAGAPFFFYQKDTTPHTSFEGNFGGGIGTMRYTLPGFWFEATVALAGESSESSINTPENHLSNYLFDLSSLTSGEDAESLLTLSEMASAYSRSLTKYTSLHTSKSDFGFNSGLFTLGYDFVRTPDSLISLYGLAGMSMQPYYSSEWLKENNITGPILLDHRLHGSLGVGLDTIYTFYVDNDLNRDSKFKANARFLHQFERFRTLKDLKGYFIDKEVGFFTHALPYNYFNQKQDVGTIIDFLLGVAYRADIHTVEIGYNPKISFNPYFVLVPKELEPLAQKRFLDSYTRHTFYGQYSFTLNEAAHPFSVNVGASYGFVPNRTSTVYAAWLGFSYYF